MLVSKKDLRGLLIQAREALDPDHQSISWPDPIKWDWRPLDEQARDVSVLLEAEAEGA